MFAKQKSISIKWLMPLVLTFAIVLSACGGQGPASNGGNTGGTGGETGSGGETGGEAVATEAPSSGGIAGACANQYYPVAEGSTHTYSVTGGTEDFSYTETISGVSANGFTVNTAYALEGNLQVSNLWACQSDGLVALDYSGGPSAALSTEGLRVDYNTTSNTGVTIPSNIAVGSTWNQTLSIEGDMVIGEGMTGHAIGNVSYTANALSNESVTTAAGTFDAIKVEMQQSFDVSADVGGVSMPLSFTGTTTTWYAAGVGMVKSVISEDLMGTTYTVELQSYAFPYAQQ